MEDFELFITNESIALRRKRPCKLCNATGPPKEPDWLHFPCPRCGN